jgi:hypothetical protein
MVSVLSVIMTFAGGLLIGFCCQPNLKYRVIASIGIILIVVSLFV